MPINPQPDSSILMTLANRQDLADARGFVQQTDQLDPQARQTTLERNGLDEKSYQTMKIKTGMAPMPTPGEGQAAGPPDSAAPQNDTGPERAAEVTAGPAGLNRAAEGMKDQLFSGMQAFRTAMTPAELDPAFKDASPEEIKAENDKRTQAGVKAVMPMAMGADTGGGAPEAPVSQGGIDDGVLKDFAEQRAAAMQKATRGQTVNPETGYTTVRPKLSEFTEAYALPVTEQEVSAMPPGMPRLASQNVALVNFVGDQATELHQLAKDAATAGDDAAKGQVAQKFVQLMLNYEPKLQSAMHESGRAVGILGDPTSTTNNFIRQFTDLAQHLSEHSDLDADGLTTAIANMKSPAQISSMASQAAAMGPWELTKDVFHKLYINTLLSWGTAGVKAASDAASLIYQPAARGLAQVGSRAAELATGNAYGTMGTRPGETQALLRGYSNSFGEAMRYFVKGALSMKPEFQSALQAEPRTGFIDVPRVGQNWSAGTGWEGSPVGNAIDYLGHVISMPPFSGIRGVVGVDQFAKTVNYRGELSAIAQRDAYDAATSRGLAGADHSTFVTQMAGKFLRNPMPSQVREALSKMDENTFTAPLTGGIGKWINDGRNSSYFARTMLPFFGTPTNITLQAYRNSPLGLLPSSNGFSSVAMDNLRAGGGTAAVQAAKMAMGTALMGLLTHHALEGNVTGARPANPVIGRLWDADHQEYSLKVPVGTPGSTTVGKNAWISYKRIPEPFSWQMALAADSAPMWAHLKDNDATAAAGVLGQAAANEFERQPMWGVLHNGLQTLEDVRNGQVNSIGQELGRMAPVPFPSTITNFQDEKDPVRRQTLTFMDSLRAKIPYLRLENPVITRNALGEPVPVPPGFLYNEFPAFVADTKGEDPIVDKLLSLNKSTGFVPPDVPKAMGGRGDPGNIDTPPEELFGATLTPEERSHWQELRGNPYPGKVPSLRDRLQWTFDQPQFQKMKDPLQAEMVKAIFDSYTSLAGNALQSDPKFGSSIQNRVMAARVQKASSKLPRGQSYNYNPTTNSIGVATP